MSQFIGAFEVNSKLSGQVYQCRFSHMWNGIATRHADTIDTKFFVDGQAHVVGLAHTAFVKFRPKAKRALTDREASFVAAEYLRERTEEDDAPPLDWHATLCSRGGKTATGCELRVVRTIEIYSLLLSAGEEMLQQPLSPNKRSESWQSRPIRRPRRK